MRQAMSPSYVPDKPTDEQSRLAEDYPAITGIWERLTQIKQAVEAAKRNASSDRMKNFLDSMTNELECTEHDSCIGSILKDAKEAVGLIDFHRGY